MNEIIAKIWNFGLYATPAERLKIGGQNQGPKIGRANGPLGPQAPSALQTRQMFFNLSTFLSIAIESLGNILLRTVKLFKQLVICLSLFNN